jgi:hypothetical protein
VSAAAHRLRRHLGVAQETRDGALRGVDQHGRPQNWHTPIVAAPATACCRGPPVGHDQVKSPSE